MLNPSIDIIEARLHLVLKGRCVWKVYPVDASFQECPVTECTAFAIEYTNRHNTVHIGSESSFGTAITTALIHAQTIREVLQ